MLQVRKPCKNLLYSLKGSRIQTSSTTTTFEDRQVFTEVDQKRIGHLNVNFKPEKHIGVYPDFNNPEYWKGGNPKFVLIFSRDDIISEKHKLTKKTELSFDKLRHHNLNRQKEWETDDEFGVLYFGVALGGEVGELLNVIKKLAREDKGAVGSRATKQDMADEIADVAIYLDLLANKAGIDITKAIKEKFNKTSDKYGLKEKIS